MPQFLVADTLTRKIIGELFPSDYSVEDPLRTPGTGTLTIPLDGSAKLAELIKPHARWLAIRDDDGRFVWAGPIPRRPARTGGQITVPLVDWRSWFFQAQIRPLDNGNRRNYIRTGSNATEQTVIMTDLMRLALDTDGAPSIVIDDAPDTDTTREITAMMLDRSIGQHLDSIRDRGGPDWYTYVTQDSPTTLLPHIAVGWPERRTRESTVQISYRVGSGGNCYDYAWPEGEDYPSRVWALGAGDPPDQVYVSDEYPEIADGTEVAWETVLGPLDGVTKSATAFDYAFTAVQKSRGFSGSASFSAVHERIRIGDVGVGDRAHVVLDDGWITADIDNARIVSWRLEGGRDKALQQTMTVDLSDTVYASQSDPGEAVGDDS